MCSISECNRANNFMRAHERRQAKVLLCGSHRDTAYSEQTKDARNVVFAGHPRAVQVPNVVCDCSNLPAKQVGACSAAAALRKQ